MKVAVIGAGPAGMTAAYELAKAGVVVQFEQDNTENVILSRSAAEAKNLAKRRSCHEILRPTASEGQLRAEAMKSKE